MIVLSVTSIKTALTDKILSLLKKKKNITRDPVDYKKKKKKKPTMAYYEQLYRNPYENLGEMDKFLET